MAVQYDVPAGQTLVISGPANVAVKGHEVPAVVNDAAELVDSAPVLSALEPNQVESGAGDLTLVVSGTGFDATSIIVFGNYDEPTTLAEDGNSVSTIVKPSLFAPATVPVAVRNGPARSAPIDFTFVDPGMGSRKRKDQHHG